MRGSVTHVFSRFAVVLLVGAALAQAAAPAAASATPVKLMVLGETHGTEWMTKSLVSIAQSKGATGCVCPGDFIYGDWDSSPSQWRTMMSPFMGNMMPAQGNHDWPWSDWSSMFPDGRPYYAKDVNGVHFIALNPEHSSLSSGSTQRTWLEARLAERDPSALKVVFLHRPWWLPDGAVHPTSEFEHKAGTSASTMYALMEKHGVDLVVSGHERNYQHSTRNGIHYLVQGSGGPAFYTLSYDLPGAVLRLKSHIVSTLDVTPTSMTLKSYDLSSNKVEEFTMSSSGWTPPPPSTSWSRDAESFPTKTTGGLASASDFDGGKGWNLWANGHVEQAAIDAFATGEVAVVAKGTPAAGVYPTMVASVAGKEIGRATVTGAAKAYVFPAAIAKGDAVRVAFVNDLRTSTEDRNLLVDTVDVRAASGATPAPEPTPEPTPTTWRRDAEAFPTRSTGGLANEASFDGGKGWNLWANGHVEQPAAASLADGEIAIAAKGTPMGGVYPTMVVSVGGTSVGSATVGGTTKTYVFPAGAVASGAAVRVAFTNDARSSTEDRNLLLDVVDVRARSPTGPAPAPEPEPTPPPSGGADLAFDHRAGNEWWVEVKVTGTDAARVRAVEATDDGAKWTALTLRSWGNWAASFHIEPGNRVTFRATLDDGTVVASCAFTHPDGTEVCDGAAPAPEPAPEPTPDPSFDATFTNARGNAWWVEVDVAAVGGTLAGVDARVNGGAWTALSKTSWGSWARSMSAPTGSTVEFRAASTTGATDASGAYAWPP